ncbi:hypothetical protein FEF65_03265 [Mariprofundus erugo]|uniref:Uncharacterized protein n=1 Tax=Mariprofundus erugo TaxID=2528639 RepID=A0A5R9GVC4_9PROT|nr:complement resistance protein TraT [Mariprofundus erugo]TLS68729.1 hypothetical protein FEF65_03265 [Mariprofundus erugo]
MTTNFFKPVVAVIALISLWMLSGCAATQTAISKRNLDVQTKMSSTVFLDPVAPEKMTIFVQVRNTSDKQLELDGAIRTAIQGHCT